MSRMFLFGIPPTSLGCLTRTLLFIELRIPLFFPSTSVTVMKTLLNLLTFFTFKIRHHLYKKSSFSARLKSLDYSPLLKLCLQRFNTHEFLAPGFIILQTFLPVSFLPQVTTLLNFGLLFPN